jgi:DNA-directed RNA polymerase specialized sigma24 family protein
MAQGELMDALIPFLGRLCGPTALQDGRDAVQEALIAIFRNLGQLREPAAIFGWARAIAVREAVRVARQAARAIPAELAGIPAPGDLQIAADVADVLGRRRQERPGPARGRPG